VEWYDLQSELVDHLNERDRNAMAGKPEGHLTKSRILNSRSLAYLGLWMVEKRQAVLSKKKYNGLVCKFKDFWSLRFVNDCDDVGVV
jgi:hypothetical protein